MEWGWISLAVGTIVLAFVVFRYRPKKKPMYRFTAKNITVSDEAFLRLFKDHRQKNSKPLIRLVDHYASMLMFDHVTYMMAKGTASHDFLDNRRSELAKMGATDIQEIVLSGFSTILSGFKGFVSSEKHNRAMLNEKANCMGMSIRRDNNGKYYFAVIFFRI